MDNHKPPNGSVSTERCTTASFMTIDPLEVSDWKSFCTFLSFENTYKLCKETINNF